MIRNLPILAAFAASLVACRPTPTDVATPQAVTAEHTTAAVAKTETSPTMVTIEGAPKLLHSFEDARAAGLSFQPEGHVLFAAYGNSVTSYTDVATPVWDAARFRKHLIAAPQGVLYLDHVRWSSPESQTALLPTPQGEGDNGYEIVESRASPDGLHAAFVWNWRPPRGRPVTSPDGIRTYEHSRPNQAPGPETYLQIVRGADKFEVARIDGRFSHLASSTTHIALGQAFVESYGVGLIELATGKWRLLDRGDETANNSGTAAFSADGKTLAAVSWDGVLSTWTAPGFDNVSTVRLAQESHAVKSLAVHPSGAVFVGFADGRMVFCDPKSGDILADWSVPEHGELEAFQREVSAAAVSSDGTRLATAHAAVGSNVRIWQLD